MEMINELILSLVVFVSNTNSHTPVNTSDVVIVGGHADLHEHTFFVTTNKPYVRTSVHSDTDDDFLKNGDDSKKGDEVERKDEVVFIPTDRNVLRNDEIIHEDTVRMSDVLAEKRLEKETEKPTGDVLFIQGKNREKPEEDGRRRNDEDRQGEFKYIDDYDDDTTPQGTTTQAPLDCTNLDCDNSVIESICGGRVDNTEMKYRLFKNECFFRKVNCGFSYEMNRYVLVEQEKCDHVGMHVTRKPYDYPLYFPPNSRHGLPFVRQRDEQKRREVRRFEGRRAMTMDIGGSYCAHSCPSTCTEDYEPECALSAAGERRVFANHCQLDLNSCQFQLMWRKRPLAECTGGRKADMHQNRAFIDWMQRVGIVDNKGKLVMNR